MSLYLLLLSSEEEKHNNQTCRTLLQAKLPVNSRFKSIKDWASAVPHRQVLSDCYVSMVMLVKSGPEPGLPRSPFWASKSPAWQQLSISFPLTIKPGSATAKDLSPNAIFPVSPEGAMTTRRADRPNTLVRATKTLVAWGGRKKDNEGWQKIKGGGGGEGVNAGL